MLNAVEWKLKVTENGNSQLKYKLKIALKHLLKYNKVHLLKRCNYVLGISADDSGDVS